MHRNNERWSDPASASYFNSYLLRDEAVSVIRGRDPLADRPLFLYFAVPLLHMPVRTRGQSDWAVGLFWLGCGHMRGVCDFPPAPFDCPSTAP
jgi:hypothetical protein